MLLIYWENRLYNRVSKTEKHCFQVFCKYCLFYPRLCCTKLKSPSAAKPRFRCFTLSLTEHSAWHCEIYTFNCAETAKHILSSRLALVCINMESMCSAHFVLCKTEVRLLMTNLFGVPEGYFVICLSLTT